MNLLPNESQKNVIITVYVEGKMLNPILIIARYRSVYRINYII